jgi:hypothetical protein
MGNGIQILAVEFHGLKIRCELLRDVFAVLINVNPVKFF